MNDVLEKDLGEIKKQINSLTEEVTSQQDNIISSLNTLQIGRASCRERV